MKKTYTYSFAIVLLISAVSYLPLMANSLTNTFDGLWKGSFYTGYGWAIRMGRWMWPFIGLARANISSEPFTSLFTIAMTVAGACLAVLLFDDSGKHRILAVLAMTAITVNPAVLSRLSFRFQSPTFGFGFLCSVLAVWVSQKLIRWGRYRWFAASVLVICSLASYQGDIGCTCLLVLMLVISDLARGYRLDHTGGYVMRMIASILAACLVYKLIWDVFLFIFHLDAADYKGADSLSVFRLIGHLGTGILETYQAWISYFWSTDGVKNTAFQTYGFSRIVYVIPLVMIFLISLRVWQNGGDRRERTGRLILLFISVLLLPVAAGVFMLLSTDGGVLEIQLTMPYAMVLPIWFFLFVLILEEVTVPEKMSVVSKAAGFILVLAIFGSSLQVGTDQQVMKSGREASIALMSRVVQALDRQGFSLNEEVVFIGRPSDNPQFRKDELWELANDYARYGKFWLGGNCSTESYLGLLRDGGFGILMNEDYDFWEEMAGKQKIRDMSVFPSGDSLKRINGVIVVKISR